MAAKPTYEELKKRIKELEKESIKHKRAEEALHESEAKYRRLFEATKDGIIVTDSEGNILFVNPSYVEMLGYKSQEELIGKPAIGIYSKPEQRKAIFEELMSNGYITDLEIELLKKDNTKLHTLVSITIQKDEKGNMIQTEGFVRLILDSCQKIV